MPDHLTTNPVRRLSLADLGAPIAIDWYERRHELEPGQRFRLHDGSVVELDRTVPGDATQWYVYDIEGDAVFHEDRTIEPGDLAERL